MREPRINISHKPHEDWDGWSGLFYMHLGWAVCAIVCVCMCVCRDDQTHKKGHEPVHQRVLVQYFIRDVCVLSVSVKVMAN